MNSTEGPAESHVARRGWARIILGAVTSLAFIWIAVRRVDWANAWRSMARADPWWLAMALGTVLLTTLVKAVRWRLMFFPRHRELSLHRLVALFLIGQALNSVIPLRAGELARAYLVAEGGHVSRVRALWTAALEKVLDSAVLLLFVAGLSFSVGLPPWLVRAAWILTAALVISVGLVGLVVPLRAWLERLCSHLAARHAWGRRLRLVVVWQETALSLRAAREPRVLAGLSAWSVVAFLLAALTNWGTARALEMPLTWEASLLLLSALQISAVLPVPTLPGRAGLFHYLCILSLGLFGFGRDAAMVYALVLHTLVYAPIMIGGPLAMSSLNVHWCDVRRSWSGRTYDT